MPTAQPTWTLGEKAPLVTIIQRVALKGYYLFFCVLKGHSLLLLLLTLFNLNLSNHFRRHLLYRNQDGGLFLDDLQLFLSA